MTTVNDLIKKLSRLKPELREKEVKVRMQNGLDVPADILFVNKEAYSLLDRTDKIVKYILIGNQ